MESMPTRGIAFFLSFVLLWSCLGTIEVPRALAKPSGELQHILPQSGGSVTAQEGSVEHHHLDDLPSQAQNDPATETPGVPVDVVKVSAAGPATARPHAFESGAVPSPILAGPLRPPCSAAQQG